MGGFFFYLSSFDNPMADQLDHLFQADIGISEKVEALGGIA
jgi:hypothetical protein